MRAASLVAPLMISFAGCADPSADGSEQEQECAPRLRMGETIYRGAGYTEVHGNRFSTAAQADCEDEGPSPGGSVFSGRPREVAVWSLPGYSIKEVVAVRFGDAFEVYVAESLPRQQVDRILAKLSSNGE